MKIVADIIVGSMIGIVYNILCHKLGEIINSDFEYKVKVQRNLILTFVCGLFAASLAYTIFSTNEKYKNRTMKYGLYIGSFLLLFHTVLYNWHILENDTKLFIMFSLMGVLIWYAYSNYDDTDTDVEIEKYKSVSYDNDNDNNDNNDETEDFEIVHEIE